MDTLSGRQLSILFCFPYEEGSSLKGKGSSLKEKGSSLKGKGSSLKEKRSSLKRKNFAPLGSKILSF